MQTAPTATAPQQVQSGSDASSWIIAIIALLAIGGGVYLVWPSVKSRITGAPSPASAPTTTTTTTTTEVPVTTSPSSSPGQASSSSSNSSPSYSGGSTSSSSAPKPSGLQPVTGNSTVFPLSMARKSRGNEVYNLQVYLNSEYGGSLVEDGIFGSKTQAELLNDLGETTLSQDDYNNMVVPYFSGTIDTGTSNNSGSFLSEAESVIEAILSA